ncbi:MAG TPA: uroporphyrinogen-III synthase [Pyrinomonadaceae bacterium]|nr:uroporphyrinogen-III synthase [Pyrinomonadaceae bacterium]
MMNISTEKTYGIFSTPANKKIISKIKNSGAGLIEFGYEEFEKTDLNDDTEIFDQNNLADWFVFTNIYAVDFFLEELQNRNIELFHLDEVRICSFGEAVADRLRFVQLHSDIIAQKIDENKISDSILDYINNAADEKIIIVKTQTENHLISKLLAESVNDVKELKVAKIKDSKSSEKIKHLTLLKGGAIDEFIFGSVEDVTQFIIQFTKEIFYENIFDTVWGTDEITLKTLDEFGMKGFYLQK